jgi:hypothetical protein
MSMLDDFPHWFEEDDEYEVLLSVELITQTDKAYLIRHKNRQAWFPKFISHLEDDCLEYKDFFIPDWESFGANKKMSPIEGDFE